MEISNALRAELLEIAKEVAVKAAEIVRVGRSEAVVHKTKSSLNDIVTQMDIAAEQAIRKDLARLRPQDAVLGEEGDDISGTSGITWVIDPIDGTVNYLYGFDAYGISVAAVSGDPRTDNWQSEAGVVVAGNGDVWSAVKGEGAYFNDTKLAQRSGVELIHALTATGFAYESSRRQLQGEVLAKVLGQVRDIRRIGAASLDLCYLAAGKIDAYFESGLNCWDYAAGALVASETGIKVSGLHGAPASENLVMAAPPSTWEQLDAALAGAGIEKVFLK